MATVLPNAAIGFAHHIPYAFARAHGVLAQGEEGDRVVVLTRPDATVEGIAELRRVLQKPLLTRAVERGSVRHRVGARVQRRRRRGADERGFRARKRSRPSDAGPAAGRRPAGQRRAGAGDPDDQRAAAAGVAGARVRRPLRTVRGALGRALPGRRRAARRARAAARAARGARLARQDHGEPRHRREAAAAGRSARVEAGRQAGRRARVDAADGPRRAGRAAPPRQGFGAARSDGTGHERADAGGGRPAHSRAARHRARHRPHGFRQDDDALRGAVPAAARDAQHDDGRGSHRVRARWRRPDAGQSEDRSRFRPRAARRSCARIPTSS